MHESRGRKSLRKSPFAILYSSNFPIISYRVIVSCGRKEGVMKKKKAMKAIAAAGVALGGASYFQDANVVYVQAAENDGSTETVIEASEASETKEAEKTEEKPSETKAAESTETKGETSADGAGAPADGAGAPADDTGAPADDTGAAADDTGAPADNAGASTDDTETGASQENVPGDVTTSGAVEDDETSGLDTVTPPTSGTPEGSGSGSGEEDNSSETQEGSETTGPWSEAESTSTVNSTEFSNSYSEVTSVSEVGSASLSTETSEYTSTSESTSTVESTSLSKAESEYTSLSTAASEATSTYGSASTSLDSAYTSEVQSTATVIDSMKAEALKDKEISDEEAENLAQAIIKYDMASKGASIKGEIEWDSTLNAYRVSYTDSQGMLLQKLYQYKINETKDDITVFEAEVGYNVDEDNVGTITQGNKVDKDHNLIIDKNESITDSETAPEISYTIETDSTGTTFKITVKDGTGTYEYDATNTIRQVNPDGTISYILDDGYSEGTSGYRKLLNLDSTGKVKSYTVYKYDKTLVNNSNTGANLSHVTVGEHKYDLLGGSQNILYDFSYVVVADANGGWHKLTIDINGKSCPIV